MTKYLECDHCGGPAIYGRKNITGGYWYADGDGERCETCGYPGHVSVDEDECDCDEDCGGCGGGNIAYWSLDDSGSCRDPSCDECRAERATAGKDGGR